MKEKCQKSSSRGRLATLSIGLRKCTFCSLEGLRSGLSVPSFRHLPLLWSFGSSQFRFNRPSKFWFSLVTCAILASGAILGILVAHQHLQHPMEKCVFPVYGTSSEAPFRIICPIDCISIDLFTFPPCICHDFAKSAPPLQNSYHTHI